MMSKDSKIQVVLNSKYSMFWNIHILTLSFNVYNGPLLAKELPDTGQIEYTTALLFLFLYFFFGQELHTCEIEIFTVCIWFVVSLFDRSQCITQKL